MSKQQATDKNKPGRICVTHGVGLSCSKLCYLTAKKKQREATKCPLMDEGVNKM